MRLEGRPGSVAQALLVLLCRQRHKSAEMGLRPPDLVEFMVSPEVGQASASPRTHHGEVRGHRPTGKIHVTARVERYSGCRIGSSAAQVGGIHQQVSYRAELEKESVTVAAVRRLYAGRHGKIGGIRVTHHVCGDRKSTRLNSSHLGIS